MTNTFKRQPCVSKTKTVLAIVHAGHGTSFATGNEQPIIIATRAAKEAKRTWGRLYKFPKETIFTATIYDIDGVEEWNYDADAQIVTNANPDYSNGKHCNYVDRYQVVL